jgi:hypothetical protein
MANSQALCNSFKGELLNGYHNFTATNPARTVNTADTFRAALYYAAGSIGASKATYGGTIGSVLDTNEVSASGTYTIGGPTVTWNAPTVTSGTAYTTPTAAITFTSFTGVAFDAIMFYNTTNGNRSISCHTFGSQTITAGTFTLTMPTNDQTTGLIRLA